MTGPKPQNSKGTISHPGYTGPRFFGAPVGDFSLFATLLTTFAVGLGSFLAATFAGIVGISIVSALRHHILDYSIAYRLIGLPFGILMLVVTGVYLGSIFIRRFFSRA